MSEEMKNGEEVKEVKELVILPDTGLVAYMTKEEYLTYLDSIYDR